MQHWNLSTSCQQVNHHQTPARAWSSSAHPAATVAATAATHCRHPPAPDTLHLAPHLPCGISSIRHCAPPAISGVMPPGVCVRAIHHCAPAHCTTSPPAILAQPTQQRRRACARAPLHSLIATHHHAPVRHCIIIAQPSRNNRCNYHAAPRTGDHATQRTAAASSFIVLQRSTDLRAATARTALTRTAHRHIGSNNQSTTTIIDNNNNSQQFLQQHCHQQQPGSGQQRNNQSAAQSATATTAPAQHSSSNLQHQRARCDASVQRAARRQHHSRISARRAITIQHSSLAATSIIIIAIAARSRYRQQRNPPATITTTTTTGNLRALYKLTSRIRAAASA